MGELRTERQQGHADEGVLDVQQRLPEGPDRGAGEFVAGQGVAKQDGHNRRQQHPHWRQAEHVAQVSPQGLPAPSPGGQDDPEREVREVLRGHDDNLLSSGEDALADGAEGQVLKRQAEVARVVVDGRHDHRVSLVARHAPHDGKQPGYRAQHQLQRQGERHDDSHLIHPQV